MRNTSPVLKYIQKNILLRIWRVRDIYIFYVKCDKGKEKNKNKRIRKWWEWKEKAVLYRVA